MPNTSTPRLSPSQTRPTARASGAIPSPTRTRRAFLPTFSPCRVWIGPTFPSHAPSQIPFPSRSAPQVSMFCPVGYRLRTDPYQAQSTVVFCTLLLPRSVSRQSSDIRVRTLPPRGPTYIRCKTIISCPLGKFSRSMVRPAGLQALVRSARTTSTASMSSSPTSRSAALLRPTIHVRYQSPRRIVRLG